MTSRPTGTHVWKTVRLADWNAEGVSRRATIPPDDARYSGYLFCTHQKIGRIAAQTLGVLCHLLRRRVLSLRKSVLLYKQLILLMMYYACPVMSSAALSHTQKLQVFNSSVFALRTTHFGT